MTRPTKIWQMWVTLIYCWAFWSVSIGDINQKCTGIGIRNIKERSINPAKLTFFWLRVVTLARQKVRSFLRLGVCSGKLTSMHHRFRMCQIFATLFRPLALILNQKVAKNTTEGRRVLIVTNLISSGIIKARMQDDLTGLVPTFNEDGLVEYPDFVTWISKTVSALSPWLQCCLQDPLHVQTHPCSWTCLTGTSWQRSERTGSHSRNVWI